jgi:hypothetical protein
MALWGTADGIYSPGTVAVDYAAKTITGTGTSFRSAGISTGTVISIGAGITFGEAVVSAVTSETLISIASTQFLSGLPISGVAYTMSQKPVYVMQDSNYTELPAGLGTYHSVYGVDVYEAQSAVNTKQKVSHAGWVGVHTYIDMHGNYRVKSETLVAFSGITTGVPSYTSPGDASDDTAYPDTLVTITSQPISLTGAGVTWTSSQTFSVVASAVPSSALTYQWQVASGVGAAYTNLTNAVVYGVPYTGTTTNTVSVGTTTIAANRPDGYFYRVVVTATNTGATATSDAAELNYA